MTWQTYHERSELAVCQAEALQRMGNRSESLVRYIQAAKAEELAIESLDKSNARTLGVTIVSAINLWIKANNMQRAKSLAYLWLAHPEPLPSWAISELEDLLKELFRMEAANLRQQN
jgi:hypothetical protein